MIRNTVQRQIILETAKKLRTHPTVDALYMEIHKNHPTISKATVYRNLRQFARDHTIRRLWLPDEPERYDGYADPHSHFKCTRCETWFDVDLEYPKEIDAAVSEKYGFQVDAHDVLFRGVCPQCRAAGPVRGDGAEQPRPPQAEQGAERADRLKEGTAAGNPTEAIAGV